MNLIIDKKVYDAICKHAEADYPSECCGFVFGKDENSARIISKSQIVSNNEEGDQGSNFRIDPEDYRLAERYADQYDLELLGVYHSHPDHPPEPSEHDRKSALPFFSYIIISVENGHADELRSWQLDENRNFLEEPVKSQRILKQKITHKL